MWSRPYLGMIMVKMLLAIFYSGTLNTNASCDGAQTEKEDTIFSAFQVMTSALDLWLTSAGFVPQHIRISAGAKTRDLWLNIVRKSCGRKKKCGICGTALSASPSVTKQRGTCGTTLSANPAVAKKGTCGILHYPQIPRSQKTRDLWHDAVRKSRGRKKTHRICGTKKTLNQLYRF
jgi:hypothetical protein